MKAIELSEGLYWTGVVDKDLKVFDIVMETKYGTTYNAYLLKGSKQTALFETAKAGFMDEFFERLATICDIKAIDYLIVDHTEPDHSGSIEHLLALNPELTVVGTVAAMNFLKEIVNHDFKKLIVKDGDTISLGNKTLEFMPLPNLHWPDTMFTYIREDQVLISCDVFGAHYSDPVILRSLIKDEHNYREAERYYFDMIISPFKDPYMTNALKRIAELPIKMICTGHGPVIDVQPEAIMADYAAWCKPAVKDKKLVVIPYVSAYGYTRLLAETIGSTIAESGMIEVEYYDMVTADRRQVLARLAAADGILFGTPTIVGEALPPIWDLASELTANACKGKVLSAFGSYGWSGEGVPHIIERLRQLKTNVIDGYRIRFKPTDEQLEAARAYAREVSKNVLNKC